MFNPGCPSVTFVTGEVALWTSSCGFLQCCTVVLDVMTCGGRVGSSSDDTTFRPRIPSFLQMCSVRVAYIVNVNVWILKIYLKSCQVITNFWNTH